MSSRGQSLSMFVVQRSFSRVRRGYDPDEVDRHLELVSQWFTSTDVGRTFRQARAELERRERAVAAKEAELSRQVEGARLEADATLEGARRRADADALAAEQTLTEARQRAAAIRADAERERAALVDRARAEAAAIRAEAERQRSELLDNARAEAAAAEIVQATEQRSAALACGTPARASRRGAADLHGPAASRSRSARPGRPPRSSGQQDVGPQSARRVPGRSRPPARRSQRPCTRCVSFPRAGCLVPAQPDADKAASRITRVMIERADETWTPEFVAGAKLLMIPERFFKPKDVSAESPDDWYKTAAFRRYVERACALPSLLLPRESGRVRRANEPDELLSDVAGAHHGAIVAPTR